MTTQLDRPLFPNGLRRVAVARSDAPEIHPDIIVKFDWGYGHIEHRIPATTEALEQFRGHTPLSMQVEFEGGKLYSRWIYPHNPWLSEHIKPRVLLRFPGAADLLYVAPASTSLVVYAYEVPAQLWVIFGEAGIYHGRFPESSEVDPMGGANWMDGGQR